VTGVPLLEVRSPGLLSTVQDDGRPGAAALGVPRSGACDARAMAAANLLLGNRAEAPVLEMSLLGPHLLVLAACTIATAGADLQAVAEVRGFPSPGAQASTGADAPSGLSLSAGTGQSFVSHRLAPGSAMRLPAGSELRFGAATDGTRGYLAVPGGICVEPVLGSASTCLSGGFGGIAGRALRAGDRIAAAGGPDGGLTPAVLDWPPGIVASGVPADPLDVVLRVLPGPDAAATAPALEHLLERSWGVDPRSDRVGLRLTGEPLSGLAAGLAERPSRPMVWGAIQVPPGGLPICLLADHPTIGGYPVPAVVVTADRPLLGQLGAGHRVRLEVIGPEAAQAALAAHREALRTAAAGMARRVGGGTGG
jgi:5-oxoprolinase (ATP-hydrolysing) subunit C